MRKNCIQFLLLLIAAHVAFSQEAKPRILEFPEFKVYGGVQDEANQPVGAARLCINERPIHCYFLPSEIDVHNKDLRSDFGLRPESKRIPVRSGGSLVLFHANCGGGSGSDDRYVLLRREVNGRFKNLLPKIIVTNQADVAIWDLPALSSLPVLVTADYLWEGKEAHYGDHHFEVKAYIYDAETDRYVLKEQYRTAQKYPGVDNWEQAPEVLDKERSRIIEKISTRRSG
jgi:hypothetical protein